MLQSGPGSSGHIFYSTLIYYIDCDVKKEIYWKSAVECGALNIP